MIGRLLLDLFYRWVRGRKLLDMSVIANATAISLIIFYSIIFKLTQFIIPDYIEGLGYLIGAIVVFAAAFEIVFICTIEIQKYDWNIPDGDDLFFYQEKLATFFLIIIGIICSFVALVGFFVFASYVVNLLT